MAANNKKKQDKKVLGVSLRSVVQGRSFLNLPFFRRNGWWVVAVTLMTLMYISAKYSCQDNLQQVMKLTTELDNAKTDCVNASAKYNSMIRESQMTELVKSMNIDLAMPQQPPYQLDDNNNAHQQ